MSPRPRKDTRTGIRVSDVVAAGFPVSALELCRQVRISARELAAMAADGLIFFAVPQVLTLGYAPRFADIRLREADAARVREMARPENLAAGVIAEYLSVLEPARPLGEYDRACALGRFLSLLESRPEGAGHAGA